jgi:hypothetical protein
LKNRITLLVSLLISIVLFTGMVDGCRSSDATVIPQEKFTPVRETDKSSSSGSFSPGNEIPEIAWNEAKKYEGIKAKVCGPVVDTMWASGSNGKPTFLNIGKPYPEKDRFTVVIWEEYRDNFPEPPEIFYSEKMVRVYGKIKNYKGAMEIEVRSPSEIEIQ